ncbi:hypothetical protein [Sodalis sp. dw_96]|uniref:hypothetical protein n=1 Tax=Sodalis sp. dw_96 TaxID=2719794 RepID=UPI001BD42657|nr:hypothetical protein [Sodalis sp. dw_96]
MGFLFRAKSSFPAAGPLNGFLFIRKKVFTGFTTVKTVILILLYDGPMARLSFVFGSLFQ